jgi:S1-C subfamily serine protease
VESAAPGKPALHAYGTLLYAQDLSGSGESLPDELKSALGGLQSADLASLSTITISLPPKPMPQLARRPAASTATASRRNIVQVALAAVVTVETDRGSGSGFFVSRDGYLLTNSHVIQGARRIRISTSEGEVYLATLVRADEGFDLALLQVPGYDGSFLALAEADDGEVGADVMAVGSPLGLQGTVTRGIISARRKFGNVPLLQTDAAINPGNSGGPLISENGIVLGINTWKLRPAATESLGFAVAASAARSIFQSYLR